MKTIQDKNEKILLPDGREVDEIVNISSSEYYRIDDALYSKDGKFVSGLSGNLNDLEDELIAETPENLKGLFGL